MSRRLPAALLLLLPLACAPAEEPNVAETGESETGSEQAPPPTWHQDVAPLIYERCTGCHTADGIAPFALTEYASAAQFADAIVTATESREMPPFLAQATEECTPPHGFEDDPTLSDEELEMLRVWAEAGAPEGDPETAAPLPAPPSLELTTKHDRYTIPGSITVDGNDDQHVCWVVDPELSEGLFGYRFLKGIQVNPGNSRVVHHVLVYTATNQPDTGEDGRYDCFGAPSGNITGLLAAWAPGSVPAIVPDGMGMAVPEDTQIVINVHYHPTGGGAEVDDSTSIDIEWLQDDEGDPIPPENVALLYLDGNGSGLMSPPFEIPAGEPNHIEEQMVNVSGLLNAIGGSGPIKLWSVGTHMHYVGTEMLMGRVNAETNEAECLIHTPRWDFNWQRGYSYDAAFEDYPELSASDRIYMRCHYDNSLGNPFVAEVLAEQGLDAPVDVYLGDDTLDEMCLGILGLSVPLSSLLP
ncbi:hypothetical protein ENSA5_59690 [Enhygromyxa salina]|uniref:Uncharacterized protein n=1 Tax=Enhygromyxa salina TaxID=215803 RepID=A0A2S9XDF2_9BACT|nr:hypothetical protein [Enhygromyxa salina]PRP90894.1 hypothetical protein ENSA5_59690 [Enhygromyxa salina]